MIPKFRVPEITEFMLGILVGNYTGQSQSMDVFIPALMLDKTPSRTQTTLSLSPNLFVSKEDIRVSSNIIDRNYITIRTSRIFRDTYQYSEFSSGSKVRIFIPDYDIRNALIVPLM